MEWHEILTYLSGGAVIGAVLFATLGRKYLESYLKEKGKNLATREDIERITDQVEAIKTYYAGILEAQRARNELRMAAVDRRLDAHQQAYSLWRKLVAYANKPEIGNVVIECQNWWDRNCLYLSAEARRAFHAAYEAAFNHCSYLQDCSNRELIEKNRSTIMAAGPKIVEGVELPSLGNIESAVLEQPANDS